MSLQNVQVNVESSSYAVGQALAKFVSDVKASFASGSTVEEAISVATAALSDLVPVLGQVQSIGGEAQSDPADEATTVFLTGLAIYNAIKGSAQKVESK